MRHLRHLATFSAILLFTSVRLWASAGLQIKTVEADLTASPPTLTIDGKSFGSDPNAPLPIVELDDNSGLPLIVLPVLSYAFDDVQIVAELPPGTLPGDYIVRVTDALGRSAELPFTIDTGNTKKFEISAAEPDVAGGRILIAGASLGDENTLPGDFNVSLFEINPSGLPSVHRPLPVLRFDFFAQQIEAALPFGLQGTYVLTVTEGNETDTLDVTIDADMDLDPANEFQTLFQVGSDVTLSDGGGRASINDADADSTNELNTSVTFEEPVLLVTDAGGTLSADLSSLVNDADLAQEVADRIAADTAETTARVAADAAETAARVAADDAEASARIAADDALSADLAALGVRVGTNEGNIAALNAEVAELGGGAIGGSRQLTPMQVALLRWYDVNQTGLAFPMGGSRAGGMAFDGENIWVLGVFSNTVTKLRASDGENLGVFPTGGSRPGGIAFDGANIWVTNRFIHSVISNCV